jgi:hypothetical protein
VLNRVNEYRRLTGIRQRNRVIGTEERRDQQEPAAVEAAILPGWVGNFQHQARPAGSWHQSRQQLVDATMGEVCGTAEQVGLDCCSYAWPVRRQGGAGISLDSVAQVSRVGAFAA